MDMLDRAVLHFERRLVIVGDALTDAAQLQPDDAAELKALFTTT